MRALAPAEAVHVLGTGAAGQVSMSISPLSSNLARTSGGVAASAGGAGKEEEGGGETAGLLEHIDRLLVRPTASRWLLAPPWSLLTWAPTRPMVAVYLPQVRPTLLVSGASVVRRWRAWRAWHIWQAGGSCGRAGGGCAHRAANGAPPPAAAPQHAAAGASERGGVRWWRCNGRLGGRGRRDGRRRERRRAGTVRAVCRGCAR